jgi:hypothetical protein
MELAATQHDAIAVAPHALGQVLIDGHELASLLRLDYRYVTEKVIFAPGFPKAIRVTPRSHRKWLLREIMAWIETRKEAA